MEHTKFRDVDASTWADEHRNKVRGRDGRHGRRDKERELRAAESGPVEEDNVEDSQTRDSTSARTLTPEMRKTPEKTDSAKKH